MSIAIFIQPSAWASKMAAPAGRCKEAGRRSRRVGASLDRPGCNSAVQAQAGQDARKNMAVPFVLVLPDGTIAGDYTLSSTSVQLVELPAQTARKLH